MLILLVPSVMRPLTICLYLSRRYDHAVQMDPREDAVEITPARGAHRLMGEVLPRAILEDWERIRLALNSVHKARRRGP